MQAASRFDIFSAIRGMQPSYTLRCNSMAMRGRDDLERGDKIILPVAVLDQLTRMHVQYPMLFRLENLATKRATHVGVSEFTADEGRCYIPHRVRAPAACATPACTCPRACNCPPYMHAYVRPHACARAHVLLQVMRNLGLDEHMVVVLTNVTLPKATYVKLRPHSTAFTEISDPRAAYVNTGVCMHSAVPRMGNAMHDVRVCLCVHMQAHGFRACPLCSRAG